MTDPILVHVPLHPDTSLARYCEDESNNQLAATFYEPFAVDPHVAASTGSTCLLEILACLTGAVYTIGLVLR